MNFRHPILCIVARDCVLDNRETPSGVDCHLQSTIQTFHSTINLLLHCAASNTVDSQCLPISISMSVNTIPLSLQRTECIPRLYISIVLIKIAKRRLPTPGLYT